LSLSYQKFGFGIWDSRSGILEKSIPDPGSRVKKASDPGSGTANFHELDLCSRQLTISGPIPVTCKKYREVKINQELWKSAHKSETFILSKKCFPKAIILFYIVATFWFL
jgi:hypothetical protein